MQIATLCLAAAMLVACAPEVEGQARRQRPAAVAYNKQAETTVTGTVQSVTQQQRAGLGTGTHLMVRTTAGQNLDVHLGPTAYLEQQQLRIEPGDTVEITGARTIIGGQTVMLARQVCHDNRTVTLRDSSGKPMWAGSGRGPGSGRGRGRGAGPGSGQASRVVPYDTATEVSFRGTVENIRVYARPGMITSTHATVRTPAGESITVELAPPEYLEQQQLTLERGEEVEITGARVQYEIDEAVVARRLTQGDRTFTLRSADGAPRWQTAPAEGAAARPQQ